MAINKPVTEVIQKVITYISNKVEIPVGVDRDDIEQEIALSTVEMLRRYPDINQGYLNLLVRNKIEYYIKKHAKYYQRNASLYTMDGDDYSLFQNLINGTSNEFETGVLNEDFVENMLNALSERDVEILTKYFGLRGEHSRTLRRIADETGKAEETMRLRLNKAFRNIKKQRLHLFGEFIPSRERTEFGLSSSITEDDEKWEVYPPYQEIT